MQRESGSSFHDLFESGSDSALLFRNLAESVSDPAWVAFDDGGIAYANPRWADIFGERLDDASLRSIAAAIHPGDLAGHTGAWNRAVETRSPYEANLRLRLISGGYRQCRLRAVPVPLREMQAFVWVGVCTELAKQAVAGLDRDAPQEVADHPDCGLPLHERYRRLELVIEAAQAAIAYCDRERRFRFVNKAYADRFGLEPKDFLVKHLHEMLGVAAFQKVSSSIDRVLSGEEVQFETEIELPRLGHRHLQVHYSPCIDHGVDGFVGVVQDITEQKRADEALRRSEERYRAIVEGQAEMVCRFRPEGTILFANAAYARCRGTTPDSLVGTNIWESVAAEDREAVHRLLDGLSPETPQVSIENRFRTVEGDRWTLWTNRGLAFDDEGNATEVQSAGIDITRRKKVEHALRESEERYRTLFNSIDEGFCVMEVLFDESGQGCDHRFIEVNPAFERHTGLVDAVGKTALELVPDLEPQWPKRYGRIALSGKGERFVDQSPAMGRWFEADAFRIGDPEQRRVALLFTDVTARMVAEQALSESEERFRTLADNIAQLAWMAEKDGTIIWYNRRWYEFAGTDALGDRPGGWQSLLGPDHAEAVRVRLQQHIDAGKRWEDTFPLRRKDDRYRWFLARALPIRGDDGKIIRWFGTLTDVTEQRRAEDALREADRRKDEFLATLAHELRNPLAPIRSGLEVMKLRANESEEMSQIRDMMERQTVQLVRLIDDLLDLSRITRGRIELRKQMVQLHGVIRNAVEACQPTITEAGHEFSVRNAAQSVIVDADPHRLTQAVANLLNNAAKYTEKGGKIWLSVGADDDQVTVEVKDTGIGIPVEMQRRVFEMFTQVKTQRSNSGLGIGLTLVKSLVELHGGEIQIESQGEGLGTTVRLHLPIVAECEAAPRVAVAAERVDLSGLNVLVVDDTRSNVFMLRKVLESHGCRVREAYDGQAAINVASEHRPDAIVMDIGMPKMDGYEAAKQIRSTRWGKHMLLVALTGWGQEDDRVRAREAGFDHHLVKPPEPSLLRQILVSAKPGGAAITR